MRRRCVPSRSLPADSMRVDARPEIMCGPRCVLTGGYAGGAGGSRGGGGRATESLPEVPQWAGCLPAPVPTSLTSAAFACGGIRYMVVGGSKHGLCIWLMAYARTICLRYLRAPRPTFLCTDSVCSAALRPCLQRLARPSARPAPAPAADGTHGQVQGQPEGGGAQEEGPAVWRDRIHQQGPTARRGHGPARPAQRTGRACRSLACSFVA